MPASTRSPRPAATRLDHRRRPWLAVIVIAASAATVLAFEPSRAAVGRLVAGIHDGFLVVFLQAGSFVAGCF